MSHTPNNLNEMFASRLNQLNAEIAKTEDTIYNLETDYLLQDSTQIGSVFKGFEGFLSSKEAQKASRRAGLRTYKTEDRLFSLSSTTSPATRELANPPDDSAVDGPMPIRGKGSYATKGPRSKTKVKGVPRPRNGGPIVADRVKVENDQVEDAPNAKSDVPMQNAVRVKVEKPGKSPDSSMSGAEMHW